MKRIIVGVAVAALLFAAGQIGKGERNDNNTTFYKLAHASSSSSFNS